MNYPSAIVVAAGIVAGALLLNGQGASQTSAGHYAISPSTQGISSAWRMDTTTGKVSYCVPGRQYGAPNCSQWSQDVAVAPAPHEK